MNAPSDDWNGIFSGICHHDVHDRIPIWISLIGACSEEASDLLCDRVKVNVVETGSGRQTRHGAHLRETQQKQRVRILIRERENERK